MCGIAGIKIVGDEDVAIRSMIDVAHLNRHRGKDDGFGIIDLDAKKAVKFLWTLDEVKSEQLLRARGETSTQIGIVKYEGFNPEYFQEKQEKFKSGIEKLKSTRSQNIILHHRSASAGNIKLANTHPIAVPSTTKKENIFYLHNGTLWGFHHLGAFMEMELGIELKGQTDTEVLGHLLEFLLKKHKGNQEKVWADLNHIAPGWGVLVRVSNNYETVEIYKSRARSLWFYVSNSEVFYISEPVAEIAGYDALYQMDEGYYRIGDEVTNQFWDRTDWWKQVQEMWKSAVENGETVGKYKCDDCQEEKYNVLRIPYAKSNRNKSVDICFGCWVEDEKGLTYGRK